MKSTFYQEQEFLVENDVYEPAEDTFFIADNLNVSEGEKVLEIGTGCGILAILAAKLGGQVLATDINPVAIECAKKNAKNQDVFNQIEFKLGNLFDSVEDEEFDLIIFNPPYLPVSESESQGTLLEKAWDGGSTGRKIIDNFIDELPNYLKEEGRSIFVQSSLSDPQETIKKLKKRGFQVNFKTEKLSFEKLYLFQVSMKSPV